jgi:SAM-dependent methyltransferase
MLERSTARRPVAIATRAIACAALVLAACAPPPAPAPAPSASPSRAPATESPAKAAAAETPSAPPPGAYGECEPTPDGIGRTYFGREIAHFMSHAGIPWLERDSRESEERTSALLDALELRPGMCVADIGAGSGRLTVPMARRVAPGTAYGTDIQPEMLAFLEARARAEGLSNLKGILGDTQDVHLPESGVDLVLLVDAYHEFDHPWEMSRSILRALRPGGRVALVEFRAEDPEVPIKGLHKMTEAQCRREFEAAGFRWVRTDAQLPWQHLVWFERPADGP